MSNLRIYRPDNRIVIALAINNVKNAILKTLAFVYHKSELILL